MTHDIRAKALLAATALSFGLAGTAFADRVSGTKEAAEAMDSPPAVAIVPAADAQMPLIAVESLANQSMSAAQVEEALADQGFVVVERIVDGNVTTIRAEAAGMLREVRLDEAEALVILDDYASGPVSVDDDQTARESGTILADEAAQDS